jgi:predicted dehydrogenase
MTGFATVPSSVDDPLPVVCVGAGSMGRAWLAAIQADPAVRLAGVADIDISAARSAVGALGVDVPIGANAVELAAVTGARAVVNVTVPAAHHPVTTAALRAGLPVLGEKPVAGTLAEALSLAAAAEVTGQLFMVSQSRRWNPQVFALRGMISELGEIGSVSTEFFRAPRFGGFRDRMAHPLLVDMAIHPFDTARFLLAADPVSVYCDAWNPPWSWYAGDASATAVFEMSTGARFTYTGSWCAPGAETSWNGTWRVSGEKGSAHWDGDHAPTLSADDPATPQPPSPYDGIAGALRVFTDALRTGTTPMGEVHENVMSLAMVAAAVESATRHAPVQLDDILDQAHQAALTTEPDPTIRAALTAWPSPRATLTPPVP